MSAGYFVSAGAIDPTLPGSYGAASLFAELPVAARRPVMVDYSFTVIDDTDSDRLDFKNSVKCRVSWRGAPGNSLSLKTGAVWAVSNDRTTSYVQPLISGRATRMLSSADMLSGLLYIGYPVYGTVTVKGKGRGNSRSVPTSSGSVSPFRPRIPHCMVAGYYLRKITGHLDVSVQYDGIMLDPGAGRPLYHSQGIGVYLEFGIERLLPEDRTGRI